MRPAPSTWKCRRSACSLQFPSQRVANSCVCCSLVGDRPHAGRPTFRTASSTDAGNVRMIRGSPSAPRPALAAILVIDFIVVLACSRVPLTHHETTNCHYEGAAFQPEFSEPIVNLTIPLGRDAIFRCYVHHLGGYRVGWVKADTKAIQAIHDHVITHNPRVSVSHNDHTTWNLHIKNVQEEDSGLYMCQINTDPMTSQLGVLDVVVSPDFIPEDTSGDVMVPEGGTVKLTCKARGHPEPHVQWRREDGSDIVIREPSGVRTKVSSYQSEVLLLVKISRSEMGAYMCIATNGVPPTVSKRIMVNVNFHPVIQVPNQLVGAPLGTDVTLECYVEASPKSINYWVRDTGEMVIQSYKYDVQFVSKSLFEVRMTVIVRNLQKEDAGSYRCIAKNSLGEVESNIRLYEIPGPTRVYSLSLDEEDYNDQLGSAERDQDEELSNSVVERGRGHATLGGSRGHLTNTHENHVPADSAPSNSCPLVLLLSSLLLLFLRI